MHIPILEEVEVARLPDDVNHDMTLVFNRETALDSEI